LPEFHENGAPSAKPDIPALDAYASSHDLPSLYDPPGFVHGEKKRFILSSYKTALDAWRADQRAARARPTCRSVIEAVLADHKPHPRADVMSACAAAGFSANTVQVAWSSVEHRHSSGRAVTPTMWQIPAVKEP
jgi:hypothetical protein